MAKKSNSGRKKGSRENLGLLISLLGLLLLVNLAFSLFYFGVVELPGSEKEATEAFDDVERIDSLMNASEVLSTENFVEIDIELAEDFAVLINKEDECEGMVVAIAPEQAFSIQQGKDSQIGFRPTSHDTVRDILDQYGINVVMAKITELKEGAYFGRLILDDGDKISNLDVRPSDGVAIAVRADSPVYLSKQLLDDFGESIC